MAEPAVATANRLTPEEQAAMSEGRSATQALISRMNSGAARFMPLDELKAKDGKTVTMMIPRRFILTLDDHRQVLFTPGIAEVPVEIEVTTKGEKKTQKLADNWYLKNNGCKIYEGGARAAQVAAAEVIVGGTSTAPVKIGDQDIPAAVIVKSAFDLSGLTADGWNTLPVEHREDLIKHEIRRRNILITAGKKTPAQEADDQAKLGSRAPATAEAKRKK